MPSTVEENRVKWENIERVFRLIQLKPKTTDMNIIN